jgi:hypothetical protein
MYEALPSTYCSQAFATLVGVGVGAADVLIVVGLAEDFTGVDDGFTGTVDDLIGAFEVVTGLTEAADD